MPAELPICLACGSQYDWGNGTVPFRCKICDDPRQFVPPTGQQWTSLSNLRSNYSNKCKQSPWNPNIFLLWTEPKFAIGQTAILLRTPHGNILWDLITLFDEPVCKFVEQLGGLKAMVISHPHFYTTYVEWATRFDCPVYLAVDDQQWICRVPSDEKIIKFIEGPVGATQTILPGVTAIKAGGHFPGSLVLHWNDQLFIADTIMTVPSAHSPHPRPPGQTSYSFQWSIPNMIPLTPAEITSIWRAIKPYNFHTTYGAFDGMIVRDKDLKGRILHSMKAQVRRGGWEAHELFNEQAL